MSKDRLLSDEELREEINIALTEFKAKVLLSTAKDNEAAYALGNNKLFDLINTQKRIYAESVIGEDEDFKSIPGSFKTDIRNKLRAEQRARMK